jgi:hypothetical protein
LPPEVVDEAGEVGIDWWEALIPYRQGLLPSVRVFIDHLATEFPKAVVM